jgi:DNA-binding CsgD family transcriptional regulator
MVNVKWPNWVLAGGLVGVFALLMAVETLHNQDGMSLTQFVFEALEFCLVIVIAAGIIQLVQWLKKKDAEHEILVRDLQAARTRGQELENEVHVYLDGSRLAMHLQFGSWGVTKAEEEVGLLILRGLSHKQIAVARGTSEATVRQQAQSIYEKSGLPGKAALLSFFLEGFFSAEA